jgi:hypothetical protein
MVLRFGFPQVSEVMIENEELPKAEVCQLLGCGAHLESSEIQDWTLLPRAIAEKLLFAGHE